MKNRKQKTITITALILVAVQCDSYTITPLKRQRKIPYRRFIRGNNSWDQTRRFKTSLNDATVFDGFADLDEQIAGNSPNLNNLESKNVKGEMSGAKSSDAPSVQEIVKFAVPAIGIYLCSPLLAMIDTSTVGLLCGTLQQAALNPAVTITDYSARTMSFLYTATTNSIARAKGQKSKNEVREMFLGSLRLSALVGTGLAIFLLLTSQSMITPLVGNENIDVEVLHAAWRYVAIRALGMPAAAMIGTSQAACLGLKDNQTPLRAIVLAAVLNLVLDVALVCRKVAWVGGTAGAAWATTFSQYFALYFFFRHFFGMTAKSNGEDTGDAENLSTHGLLGKKMNLKTIMKLPSKDTLNAFKPFVIPVTITQIGRCSTYIAMGHVVSSTMNAVSMAAQQIITSMFYALIPIGDSCGITAQTYLPPILSREPSQDRTNALKKTMKNIFKVASMLGVFLSMIALSIPMLCPLMTQDPAVMTVVNQIVPIMLGILSTHGIFCGAEGVLLGFKDLKFLGNMYAVFFVTVPALMLRLKYVAKAGSQVSLRSIWDIFLGYQAFRIISFLSRLVVLRKRHASTKFDIENE